MTQPAVTIVELDGALGVLPPSEGALFAVVGVSSKGPTATPATYARVKDIVADFGSGPLVEAAAHYIERYGKPVVIVRTGQTTAGSATAIVLTGVTGTSVVSRDVAVVPIDDYEFRFKVVAGGTIGIAGITFQWSLDDGRTWSPVTALGTANTWTAPADANPSGSAAPGIKINFAAGTLVAGDFVTFRTSAPLFNSTEIADALTALANSVLTWELAEIVGALDATLFDAVDLKFSGMLTAGKYHAWIGHARVPTIGETESAYKTSLDGVFASKATIFGELCAGACKLTSSVSGRKYKRPTSFLVAAREASVSHEINIADVNLGGLVGVSIRDSNGNADEHDESINPGLDDSRFTVLRTWDGIQGVYVNRPRLFSPAGSDFQLLVHRRVLNLAHAALRQYFLRRLNKPVRVSKTTGFILEADALEIEAGARAAMRTMLLAKPKASAIEFALSRTDNILSSKTLNGQARVIPLAYPEFINLDLGFKNPALSVVAV
jgi:hypothetical protein